MVLLPTSVLVYCLLAAAFSNAFTKTSFTRNRRHTPHRPAALTMRMAATELPDSLEDAAIRAAEATALYMADAHGGARRCRVDFDTSIGDETFTLLKTSTEFMQHYVSSLCYAALPGLQAQRQAEIVAVAEARAELKAMEKNKADEKDAAAQREDELVQLIARDGRPSPDDDDSTGKKDEGPVARVYFPDEGSAALARRDWTDRVPPCVQFSACGGVQSHLDVSRDALVFFFCPKASESESVEEILRRTEEAAVDTLQMSVFVNPNLVDMGVTGFGMAGRMYVCFVWRTM